MTYYVISHPDSSYDCTTEQFEDARKAKEAYAFAVSIGANPALTVDANLSMPGPYKIKMNIYIHGAHDGGEKWGFFQKSAMFPFVPLPPMQICSQTIKKVNWRNNHFMVDFHDRGVLIFETAKEKMLADGWKLKELCPQE